MVEFPVSINKTTRKPHYMAASEQERIEFVAASYLKHVVVIISEMGLRPYKELMPMRNAHMPMTDLAWQAFRDQIEETPHSEYLSLRRCGKATRAYSSATAKPS